MKVVNEDYQKNLCKGLFVVDLDGTLLTSDRRIAHGDLKTLERLRTLGYMVAIATGRSNYSFFLLLDNLGYRENATRFPVDFVIFSTGAGLLDYPNNNLLQSFSLSTEDIRYIVNHPKISRLDFMVHRPVPDTRHFLYFSTGRYNPDFSKRLAMYGDFATIFSAESMAELEGATEILCIVDEESGHQVAAEIKVALPQYNVIKVTSPLDNKSIWIEIFPKNVSKSQTVKVVADGLGLKQDKICAVGNDYNDHDLLLWAGQSFIVANGPPDLKALFQNVASNNNCGVSDAAGKWLAMSNSLSVNR